MTEMADEVYRQLEDEMLRYSEYIDVPVEDNGEQLVEIRGMPLVSAEQIGEDMRVYTGNQILVRQGVIGLLGQVSISLAEHIPGATLQVVYGYRALEIQQRLFKDALARCGGHIEAAHRQIASPDVAGHPTGGAVDIQIVGPGGKPLDFGTDIWDFSPDSYVFSPFISEQGKRNRRMLRKIMLAAGFAPFDGEWWHFSYGDKEWAKYHGKPRAIYEQIRFKTITGVI